MATGTNDAAGKIAFSRIGYEELSDLKKGDGSYASEKTYSYKVSEVKGNAGDGITYDDKEYTVKVKVSYDQASGTMKADVGQTRTRNLHLQTAMTPRLELTWKEPRAWKEEP